MTDLPNYQQIKAWLGPGWIATWGTDFEIPEDAWNDTHANWPPPWLRDEHRHFRCHLLHTDGTRVEVRAPSEAERLAAYLDVNFFSVWFRAIRHRQSHGDEFYLSGVAKKCITWHDPPKPAAENPTDLQPGERIEVLQYVDDDGAVWNRPGFAKVDTTGTAGVGCHFEDDGHYAALYYESSRFRRVSPKPTKPEVTTLGELAVGEWFEFVKPQESYLAGPILARGAQEYETPLGYRDVGTAGCKVRRVPPPQTSAGSEQPVHDSSKPCPRCNRYLWHDARQECAGCGVTTMQLIAERSKPADPNRWPNADPAWIPSLEAKLADQLRSGGYDCVEQRSLMMRAMRLTMEEGARKRGPDCWQRDNRATNERLKSGLQVQFQPVSYGRMFRHELPDSQRLDRKRTGR